MNHQTTNDQLDAQTVVRAVGDLRTNLEAVVLAAARTYTRAHNAGGDAGSADAFTALQMAVMALEDQEEVGDMLVKGFAAPEGARGSRAAA